MSSTKEPKTLQEFIPLLQGWWDVSGFEGNVTIEVQFRKLIEEVRKLFVALEDKNKKEIKDALGDLQVVCIMGCFIKKLQLNLTIIDQIDVMFYESSHSIEYIIGGVLADFIDNPHGSLSGFRAVSLKLGYDPDECLS